MYGGAYNFKIWQRCRRGRDIGIRIERTLEGWHGTAACSWLIDLSKYDRTTIFADHPNITPWKPVDAPTWMHANPTQIHYMQQFTSLAWPPRNIIWRVISIDVVPLSELSLTCCRTHADPEKASSAEVSVLAVGIRQKPERMKQWRKEGEELRRRHLSAWTRSH